MVQPIRFQLQFACENLVNRLAIGQPKPQITVYQKDANRTTKLGHTEISAGLSPSFSTTLPFEYRFGSKQNLVVVVKNTIWHIIKRSEDKMTFGKYEIPFDVVLQSGTKGVKVKLRATASKEQKKQGIPYLDGGKCFITAYQDNPNQGRFRLDCKALKVPKPLVGSVECFVEFTVPHERNRLLYRAVLKFSPKNRSPDAEMPRCPDV